MKLEDNINNHTWAEVYSYTDKESKVVMDISTQADIYEKKGTVLRETCIKVIVTKKQTKKIA